MTQIDQNSFNSPVIGIDPVTKGTFTIKRAHIIFDYIWDDDEVKSTRASGSVLIGGFDNPLFDAVKEHPLRIQGLVASVMFGIEKRFIKFSQITDYEIIDDGIFKEINLTLIFEVLDNLEYMENIIDYRDDHKL